MFHFSGYQFSYMWDEKANGFSVILNLKFYGLSYLFLSKDYK